eukprot:356763-Hanusia_phi.AAC.1
MSSCGGGEESHPWCKLWNDCEQMSERSGEEERDPRSLEQTRRAGVILCPVQLSEIEFEAREVET